MIALVEEVRPHVLALAGIWLAFGPRWAGGAMVLMAVFEFWARATREGRDGK